MHLCVFVCLRACVCVIVCVCVCVCVCVLVCVCDDDEHQHRSRHPQHSIQATAFASERAPHNYTNCEEREMDNQRNNARQMTTENCKSNKVPAQKSCTLYVCGKTPIGSTSVERRCIKYKQPHSWYKVYGMGGLMCLISR